ncbi:Pentatricopeptide repeat-containing protein [Glycine soja]
MLMQRYGRHKSVVKRSKKYLEEAQMGETMAKRNMIKTVRDHAIHLDLLAKARGITAAKNYFVNLPESAKNHLCHGAILNCYCKEPMIEKAEGLMEKMKELSLPLSSMPYNSLIMLYTKVGQPEKVSSLIQEMKTSNIMLDSYTYNVWMRALAAVNDISSVERVHDEMKWHSRNWRREMLSKILLLTSF